MVEDNVRCQRNASASCSNEGSNKIIDTVKRILALQKEVENVSATTTCIGCNACLLNYCNNTIPVALFLNCCQPFSCFLDTSGATTTFFRLESLADNRYVTLRCLTNDKENNCLSATNQTCILDLCSVIAIECFQPITVEMCS